jgi:hypothetical protein
MIDFFKNTIRFILLVLIQVVLINQIEVTVFLSPMIIVFFLIALPLTTPNWLLLLASFVMGLTVDSFMNTPGITSFALVLAAFIRPFVLRVNQPRDGYQVGDAPSASHLGWGWYLKYSSLLVIVFHLSYFIILGFGQDNALVMIWKTLVSSLFTLVIIFLFQLFSLKNAR